MKNYNEEIRAKIDAAKAVNLSRTATKVDTCIQEQKILAKLDRAKIDAAKSVNLCQPATRVDTYIQEQKILAELDNELELSRYDLEESDILRTLKILKTLDTYPDVFKYQNALKIFYVLARVDIILESTLREYCDLSKVEFKTITKAMIRNELILKNDHEELELTLNGKSLASRIGHDFF